MGSVVYFIQSHDKIKVGWTKNIEARLRDLRTGNVDLVLVHTTPGGRDLEAELHWQFREHHVDLEWFHAEPILEWLKAGGVEAPRPEPQSVRYESQWSEGRDPGTKSSPAELTKLRGEATSPQWVAREPVNDTQRTRELASRINKRTYPEFRPLGTRK